MIHVERSAKPPAVLTSAAAKKERLRAEEFFRRSLDYQASGSRAQERFEFDKDIWRAAKEPLAALFCGKCAYCESPIDVVSSGHVDHFRPRVHAADLDGSTDPDHYYWLVNEWQNLYYSCRVCNANKRNLFPCAGEARAEPGARGEALLVEKAILLDPCRRADDPAKRLAFDAEGNVRARPAAEDKERYGAIVRGQVTIDALGLNRADLVAAREQEAESFERLWADLLAAIRSRDDVRIAEVSEYMSDAQAKDQPYAGMKRDLQQQWMARARRRGELTPILVAQLTARFKDSPVGRFVMSFVGKVKKRPARGAPAPIRQRDRRLPTGYLEKVEIRNFRSIDELDLDLRRPLVSEEEAAGRSPWKVLLGENGTGKSSVLQAVALAVIGQTQSKKLLRRMKVEARDLRRRWLDRGGRLRTAPRAEVRLRLTTGEKIELVAEKDSIRFLSGSQGVNTLVRGYGATRLLPKHLPRYDPDRPPPPVRARQVDNLFSPYVPLCDANSWMMSHQGDAFSPIGLALKDLLDIDPESGSVRRVRDRIEVETEGTRVGLKELSDGYQSVLALAVDVMAGIRQDLGDMQQATGIVLLDEIGAHLHPRWRMAIVDRLRQAFTGIQFLATTHEALCLRGLMPGEITVIRRDADRRVRTVTELPDVRYMRVDQLLTSKLFGLLTAMDRDVERDFEKYYRLLGRRDLEPEERRELEDLESRLGDKELLGSTRRERLYYRAIDRMMAEEAEHGRPLAVESAPAPDAGPGKEPLKPEVRERLLEIWDEV